MFYFVYQAAHCFTKSDNGQRKPDDLMILMGAHNITKKLEPGKQFFSVKKIDLHDSWDPTTVDFGGDIAVIELTDAVKFNKYIRPVCVAPFAIDAGVTGTVISWGSYDDSDETSDVPRKVDLTILKKRECFKREPVLSNLMWDEAFCAGVKGSGLCQGDSGSGFYVEKAGKVFISGIVSSSRRQACSDANVALYSDVFKYSDFIKKVGRGDQ